MIINRIRQLFMPEHEPTQRELLGGSRRIMVEGAVASVIYAAATNNIMTGYLGYLGASVTLCASITLIPQMGCILQLLSPFIFERLRYRKLAVWVLCVIYRFSVAAMFLIPLFLTGAPVKLGAAVGLYAIAFASAGVVTPGLQQWTLSLVDVGRRGRYLAQKDILAFSVNSVATLFLSRHLDQMIKLGNAQEGYETVGLVCLVLSVIDALLLMQVCERPAEQPAKIHLKDLLQPVKDTKYRPLLLYSTLAGLIGGISTPFLVVYQLRVLGLSHTFLASAGIAVAVSSMAGSYLWGRYSDLNTWNRTILKAAFAVFICTLSWAFVTPGSAPYIAPVLMALTSANSAGVNIANINLQYSSSPAEGKTLYIGFTSALSSIVGCLATSAGAFLQSQLEPAMGYRSIAVLFLISGAGGIINLFINGRKIPSVK